VRCEINISFVLITSLAEIEKYEIGTYFWFSSFRGRNHLRSLILEGKIILKWIFGKWGMNEWIVFTSVV
jgi:hypothetical protein